MHRFGRLHCAKPEELVLEPVFELEVLLEWVGALPVVGLTLWGASTARPTWTLLSLVGKRGRGDRMVGMVAENYSEHDMSGCFDDLCYLPKLSPHGSPTYLQDFPTRFGWKSCR